MTASPGGKTTRHPLPVPAQGCFPGFNSHYYYKGDLIHLKQHIPVPRHAEVAMKAVYALLSNFDQAEAAVLDLLDHGFDLEDMNVIMQDYVAKSRLNERTAAYDEQRMPPGLGKLMAGEESVPATDTGGVYAAGQRAAIMADTAAMPGGKGIGGQLAELGIDRETASAYLDGIKGGGLLFWIVTDDDHAGDAAEILTSHKGMHIILNPVRRMRY